VTLEERVAALEEAMEAVMKIVAQIATRTTRPSLEEAHQRFQERLRESKGDA
jgi:dihydrodipicolinate synthase/N-acetylneuraminate lyase